MRTKILILYAVSFVLGIIVGLVGSSFRLSIDLLASLFNNFYHFLDQHRWPAGLISALISMFIVLSAYLAVKYIAPQAGGSGVPEIEGALLHVRPIYWKRLLPVKYFFGILVLAAKMLLGREGPTIHIGGNLGEMLGNLVNLTRRRRDTLIAAGSAAGLAVAFNAPLAGVLFVMEEMRNQFNYSFTSFSMVAISCVTATIVLDFAIGTQPTIPMNLFEFPALDSLWLFAVLGLIVGLAGMVFNKALIFALALVDKMTMRQQVYYVLTVGFIVGYLAFYYPSAVGDGTAIIHQALTIAPGFVVLLFLLVMRFIGTMMCYATGVPGGIFSPILALGTLLGLAIFQILHFFHIDFLNQSGIFAVAGMAGLLSATTLSPITGAVLVVEMTQNYSLIFPLMMTCISATIVMQLARHESIYTQLLHRTLGSIYVNRP